MKNQAEILSKNWVIRIIPNRLKDAHKGTFGKVLVLAGSEDLPGAAYLASSAIYRVGAGLVTLATNDIVKIIVAKMLPEATFLTVNKKIKNLNEYDAVLIGPGLDQEQEMIKVVEDLIKKIKSPKLIIDAGGLNILVKIERWWEILKTEAILTPHPGEMARLTGYSIEDIQKDRLKIAQHFANKWNKIVVLKGANTVIASPSKGIVVSPFANPLLATAGTGDILAGVIAGMVAQGLDLFDAACVGVYIHGMAGEILQDKIGNAGLLASDLLATLPLVIKKLK